MPTIPNVTHALDDGRSSTPAERDKFQTDWPPDVIASLLPKLRELRDRRGGRYEDDPISEAIAAAIERPYAEVEAKGGALRYTVGILKNKAADAFREQKREEKGIVELGAVESARGEGQLSRIFSRSADTVDPPVDEEPLPSEARSADAKLDEWAQATWEGSARSSEAAREECNRRLGGDERCAEVIVRLKELDRRGRHQDQVIPKLRSLAAFASMLREFRMVTIANAAALEPQLPQEPRRETLADALDVLSLVKGRNLCTKWRDWCQEWSRNEWVQHLLSTFAGLEEEAEKLLPDIEAIELQPAAKYLLGLDPSIKATTFALLEIASGLQPPPASKGAWETRRGTLKRVLQRARPDEAPHGDSAA